MLSGLALPKIPNSFISFNANKNTLTIKQGNKAFTIDPSQLNIFIEKLKELSPHSTLEADDDIAKYRFILSMLSGLNEEQKQHLVDEFFTVEVAE